MRDIYPMHKMCRLFYEKKNDWQREELEFKIITSYPKDYQWTDEGLLMEREARTVVGEERGFTKAKLVKEYIKRYYPEHTKPSDAFGALVKVDRSKTNAPNLKADIRETIENCLSHKYGFLAPDPNESEIVYLTAEGRDFVSPPYVWAWKVPLNIGLLKAYITSMGQVWFVILNIVGLCINWILWMSDLFS